MRISADRLRKALQDSEFLPTLSLSEWDLVIRQAQRAGVLARLAIQLDARNLLDAVAAAPRQHLLAERALAEKHERDVRWEVRCIQEALAESGVPIVLLKGAAYTLAGLPPARGRLFNDIDILVPRAALDVVEQSLHRSGWSIGDIDPYDERYYRRWMHQIPPLTHWGRRTTIDVHHTIIPDTARLDLRVEKLFAAATPIAGASGILTLAPADMILHSATHLLNEGEFARGLRDLDDIAQLLRHFGRDTAFWPRLTERAGELDLRRPLYYALRYAAMLLGAPVPAAALAAGPDAPNRLLRAVMDTLFERALRPDHRSCRDGLSGTALWLLYMRSHYLRMPPYLLIPHLLRKAYRRTITPDASGPG